MCSSPEWDFLFSRHPEGLLMRLSRPQHQESAEWPFLERGCSLSKAWEGSFPQFCQCDISFLRSFKNCISGYPPHRSHLRASYGNLLLSVNRVRCWLISKIGRGFRTNGPVIKIFAACREDKGSVLSNYTRQLPTSYNSSSRGSDVLLWTLSLPECTWCT